MPPDSSAKTEGGKPTVSRGKNYEERSTLLEKKKGGDYSDDARRRRGRDVHVTFMYKERERGKARCLREKSGLKEKPPSTTHGGMGKGEGGRFTESCRAQRSWGERSTYLGSNVSQGEKGGERKGEKSRQPTLTDDPGRQEERGRKVREEKKKKKNITDLC